MEPIPPATEHHPGVGVNHGLWGPERLAPYRRRRDCAEAGVEVLRVANDSMRLTSAYRSDRGGDALSASNSRRGARKIAVRQRGRGARLAEGAGDFPVDGGAVLSTAGATAGRRLLDQ